MNNEFPVEIPRSYEEFAACEPLQDALDPPLEAKAPAWLLWELVQAGAVLLVCFDGIGIAREPLGLVLALPRGTAFRVVAYGVRRDLPDRTGIMEAVAAQLFAQTRGHGATELVWPFDPLESRWAELFLERLGAETRGYELRRDRAGEIRYFRTLASLPVGKIPREKGWKTVPLKSFFPINSTRPAPGGGREPTSWNLHLTAPLLVLEVPGEGLSALPRPLAARWGEAWEALETYLDRGYALVGLYRQGDRAFLVLERKA